MIVTGLQLDFMSLIPTLWMRPFSQFSIHLTCLLTQPILFQILYENIMKCSAESLTEIKINNILCSPSSTSPIFSLFVTRLVKHDLLFLDPCWLLSSFSPSHAWNYFPGLATTSPSQGLRWGWLICISHGSFFLPFLKIRVTFGFLQVVVNFDWSPGFY